MGSKNFVKYISLGILLTGALPVIMGTPEGDVFSNLNNAHRIKRSDDFVPCESGWYYFRNKCYSAMGRKLFARLDRDRALARCRSFGGDLASIHSQEEQDFILFLQLHIQYWAWIGVGDHEKESDYKWTDGSVFNYTNWKTGEPTGVKDENEDCVNLVYSTRNDNLGKWNDITCHWKEGYICKMDPNPLKRSPNPMYCSPEEGGGFKFQASCYHIVTEMTSWQNAERQCKDSYNGHLVTIRDKIEDEFLDYILKNTEKEVWIGIKILEQFQQKWTSGWYVSYNGFNEEKINFLDGTCVARKSKKEWIIIPCSRKLSFICEVSTASPPVLKSPAKGSYCPKELDDWRDLGGEYCYYINTTKSNNFYEASFHCKTRGGNLVSLHSREEAEMLRPFVEYAHWSIYIGLFKLLPHGDKFAWSDGSSINYENWNNNEPNNEDEKCVEAVTHDVENARKMGWNDVTCADKKAYICSIKKIAPNTSVEETNSCESFCIVPTSYLYGVIIQCAEAERLPLRKRTKK